MIPLPVAAASLLVLYILHSIWDALIHWQRARKMGASPAFTRKHRLPFALDFLQRTSKADKEQVLPEDVLSVSRELPGQPSTYQQKFLGSWNFFTSDPQNIKAMLATQFQDFELGHRRRGIFVPMLGHGIFTHDGKAWERSRALLKPQFNRQQVADLELEENHVQHLLRHLKADASGWTPSTDLSPLFFRLTLDSATEFLFGESVNTQLGSLQDSTGTQPAGSAPAKGEPDWQLFGPAFDAGTMALGKRVRLMTMYWLHNPQSFKDNIKTIHRFADHCVNKALQQHRDADPAHSSPPHPTTTKPRYVFLHELVKTTQDPTELRSQLLNILLAGRDTTAGLLGWAVWLLARHPDAYATLRTAVLSHFGAAGPSRLTFESLKACHPLQHVLSETLRLYPTVPINGRVAARDTTLPRGGGPDGAAPVYVRAGTDVTYSVHVMHRRHDLYGDDADEFRPARWAARRAGWEFLPFNGGPRVCLGQQFALTEAAYVLVRLVQRFDALESCDSDPVVRHHFSVTTSPARVLVRLREAGAEVEAEAGG